VCSRQAQKYLESHDAPAGLLVASVPPRGAFGYVLRQFKRHPCRATQMTITGKSLRHVNTPKLARENFFSAQTPESQVLRYPARLQEEFAGKWSFDELLLNLPRPQGVTTPLIVLGAECDGSITTTEVRATAPTYRTEAEIFPDIGHDRGRSMAVGPSSCLGGGPTGLGWTLTRAQLSGMPACSLAITCSRLKLADFCRCGNSASVCSIWAT
jgi:hypothetical protein